MFSFYLRWILIIAVIGLVFSMIDNAAHFGGLVTGYVIGWLAAPLRPSRTVDAVWKAIATVMVLITAAAMSIAWLHVTAALS
ncbi:MAG: rhomboid family intramembrane serine protease [Bryobacterales bacterium]